MELWIRSQDKKRLLRCNFIETCDPVEVLESDYDIVGYFDDNIGYETLGTYETKERALEVLDEIQKYILLPNPDESAYVYQMPKK